ncbi:unnamed protein product, partial [Urochloa humidicola]
RVSAVDFAPPPAITTACLAAGVPHGPHSAQCYGLSSRIPVGWVVRRVPMPPFIGRHSGLGRAARCWHLSVVGHPWTGCPRPAERERIWLLPSPKVVL